MLYLKMTSPQSAKTPQINLLLLGKFSGLKLLLKFLNPFEFIKIIMVKSNHQDPLNTKNKLKI